MAQVLGLLIFSRIFGIQTLTLHDGTFHEKIVPILIIRTSTNDNRDSSFRRILLFFENIKAPYKLAGFNNSSVAVDRYNSLVPKSLAE
jgi:hypothetical protein